MKKITSKTSAKATSKKAAKKISVAKTAKKLTGKKTSDFAKTHSISCSDKDWNTIQTAAKKAGMNVSKYIVSHLVK